jgi:acyl carrier protein
VPPGVPGQLCAAGPQLADGYHARPAATAAAFVPNPFAAAPGERLYLTGDVVRWRPGGVLEFLGRVDGQVKVRGFRIELGEIESALAAHPAVRQAAVTARPDPAGGMRLVAYTVCDDDVAAADLREWLVARLPQHMLPALIERIATLPLTPNGKVDLRALPDPLAGRAAPATRTAPETPHERALAAIWSDLLGTANVGLEDDFFDLGGHSLTATQLVSRVRTRLHVELPLRTVFEAPLLGDLARRVAALASPASAPAAEPTPLEQRICAVWREVLGRTAGIDELFPGSASQLLHVRARLAGELGAVSAAQLLAHPTIRAQALFVTTRALEARGAASADALLERAGGILSKEAL